MEIAAALDQLQDRLSRLSSVIVAFSGGVDSALLAAAAARALGDRCLAATAVSPSLAASERAAARAFCEDHGISHLEVATREFENPSYVANPPNRCYYCKSSLFDALAPVQRLARAPLALGTNVDDLSEHRPGHRAALERGALTPLADAGFTKARVREATRSWGLAVSDKPAAPCLSSRVAYGEPVTPAIIRQVELAEAALHELGFDVVRVRSHANGTVARVEVPRHRIREAADAGEAIDRAVTGAGFSFCSLDLGGFRSGRLNLLVPDEALVVGGAA